MSENRPHFSGTGSSAPGVGKWRRRFAARGLGGLQDEPGPAHRGGSVTMRSPRLSAGPGYRIYFGQDGDRLVILLGGGTKKRQRKDIETARAHWKAYKTRKRKE